MQHDDRVGSRADRQSATYANASAVLQHSGWTIDANEEEEKRRPMEFQHRHLGMVSYLPDEVVNFPQGLLGYLKFKKYLLIQSEDYSPFIWMISVDDPDVGFPLLDPFLFCEDYSPNVTKRDLNELTAENPQSLRMYSIVTLNQDPRLITANLSGPILVNQGKKVGKQLVLLDDRYSTKHRILNL